MDMKEIVKKLTPKQIRFCKEYLVTLNATTAAINAGYSKATAGVIGYENLKKPHIAAFVKACQERLAQETEVKAEWVVRRLKENEKASRDQGDIAQSNRALELLGKHIGMFGPKPLEQRRTVINVISPIPGPPGEFVDYDEPSDSSTE